MTFSEARQDAERLKKITKREIDVATVTCCNYDKSCDCGGEGISYEHRYSFCNHVVPDGPDEECSENDCIHKEYLASIKREEELEAVTN